MGAQKGLFTLAATPLDADAQALRLYEEYPRKANKGDALTAIRKALKEVGYETLHAAVVEYAKACAASHKEKEFIPYPASWMRARKWEDDRSLWWQGSQDTEAKAVYARLIKFARRHGMRHPAIDDADFVRAKNVAKLCNGGWAAFCDGKVTEKEFVAAWKDRK